jgi:transcriptional regulator with XRE-family HTH domain
VNLRGFYVGPIKAKIKAELLGWARQRAGVTLDDAAKAADVEVAELKGWENGDDTPTISQLRHLSAKYHFPLAFFYLPEPPQTSHHSAISVECPTL